MGLKGNEAADRIAKSLNMEHIMDNTFGKGEGKAILKTKISELWQKEWVRTARAEHTVRYKKQLKQYSRKQ